MATRLALQSELEELLGSRNVYYQPPESVKLDYPAILYFKSTFKTRMANDSLYTKMKRYELIVIDRKPDNPVLDKLLELPYCSHDRYYSADNLHHDVFTLYF